MKRATKILAFLLALVLTVGMIPAASWAEEDSSTAKGSVDHTLTLWQTQEIDITNSEVNQVFTFTAEEAGTYAICYRVECGPDEDYIAYGLRECSGTYLGEYDDNDYPGWKVQLAAGEFVTVYFGYSSSYSEDMGVIYYTGTISARLLYTTGGGSTAGSWETFRDASSREYYVIDRDQRRSLDINDPNVNQVFTFTAEEAGLYIIYVEHLTERRPDANGVTMGSGLNSGTYIGDYTRYQGAGYGGDVDSSGIVVELAAGETAEIEYGYPENYAELSGYAGYTGSVGVAKAKGGSYSIEAVDSGDPGILEFDLNSGVDYFTFQVEGYGFSDPGDDYDDWFYGSWDVSVGDPSIVRVIDKSDLGGSCRVGFEPLSEGQTYITVTATAYDGTVSQQSLSVEVTGSGSTGGGSTGGNTGGSTGGSTGDYWETYLDALSSEAHTLKLGQTQKLDVYDRDINQVFTFTAPEAGLYAIYAEDLAERRANANGVSMGCGLHTDNFAGEYSDNGRDGFLVRLDAGESAKVVYGYTANYRELSGYAGYTGTLVVKKVKSTNGSGSTGGGSTGGSTGSGSQTLVLGQTQALDVNDPNKTYVYTFTAPEAGLYAIYTENLVERRADADGVTMGCGLNTDNYAGTYVGTDGDGWLVRLAAGESAVVHYQYPGNYTEIPGYAGYTGTLVVKKLEGLDTDSVNDTLNSINSDTSLTAADDIRQAVQKLDTEELSDAMKSDSDNTGTTKLVKDLEDKTGGTAKVTVTQNVTAMDQSDVSIVGANLNTNTASDPSSSPIELLIDKPGKNHDIVAYYDGTSAVQFSMTLKNVPDPENLEVPVKVTLPVPSGLDANKLVVIHYKNDGVEDAFVPYTFEQNGKYYVQFVLTGFSDFAMVQPAEETKEPENPGQETPKDDGKETPKGDDQSTSYTPVQQFVIRLYKNILGRDADPSGLDSWTNVLTSKKESGAKVAWGFIDSDEFKAQKLSNSEYLDVLYRTFLNREADASGKAAWQHQLENGVTRNHVFKGFVESDEFRKICKQYDIDRGSITLTEARDQNGNITMFVYRCYKKVLGREPDVDGLNAWTQVLLDKKETPEQVAYGFVFSEEYQKKKVSEETYVKMLYEVFLDRTYDEAGLKAWVKQLQKGESRYQVFKGFAYSDEFKKLYSQYGL